MLLLQGQGMRDAEMLVWAGDFNYRIEASYEDALDHINRNELDWLLERVSAGYARSGQHGAIRPAAVNMTINRMRARSACLRCRSVAIC